MKKLSFIILLIVMSSHLAWAQCTQDCTTPGSTIFRGLASPNVVAPQINNTIFGSSSGIGITGRGNTLIGSRIGQGTTPLSGSVNTFVGRFAGRQTTTGEFNTFLGADAGRDHTVGSRNVFIGVNSGRDNGQNADETDNVFLGTNSGLTNRGSQNTFLGKGTGENSGNSEGNVFIGFQAGQNEINSNRLYIANSNTTIPLIFGNFAQGRVSLGTAAPTAQFHTTGGVRFQGLTDDFTVPQLVGSDNDGNLFTIDVNVNGGIPINNCGVENTVPRIGADNDLICSQITDDGTIVTIGGGTPAILPNARLFVNGNTEVAGSFFTTSDKKYKKNIRIVPSALSKIVQLRGVSYSYNKEKFPKINFPEGQTIGLIAQELEKVFPELTHKNSEGLLSVNYDGLIPVLIEAIKEQQVQIEKLEAAIAKPSAITPESAIAELFQNNPNPFNQITEIKFFLPTNTRQATLYIYDMQGTQIKKVDLTGRGDASVNLQAGTLRAGVYHYALIADGKEVAMKRMIITD